MRPSFSNLAISVFLTIPLLAGSGAVAATLRLGGTGGVTEAMRQVAPPFGAATGLELEVITSLSSTGAMRGLADSVLDDVVAAREFNPDEAMLKLVLRPFARTPLVFITSHPKQNGLRRSGIAPIYASANPKWEDGTSPDTAQLLGLSSEYTIGRSG